MCLFLPACTLLATETAQTAAAALQQGFLRPGAKFNFKASPVSIRGDSCLYPSYAHNTLLTSLMML